MADTMPLPMGGANSAGSPGRSGDVGGAGQTGVMGGAGQTGVMGGAGQTGVMGGAGGTLPLGAAAGHRLPLTGETLIDGEYGTGQYRILPERLIGEGGESLVYMAERMSDGAQFAAKVYDQYSNEPIIRSNRRRTLEFLKDQSDYTKTHIMPLIDHGFVQLESAAGDVFADIPVDVIPVCPEGDVTKKAGQWSYLSLKDRIIPGIAEALRLFHTANLIHRDLKPGNIYLYNGVVVIADFGTASKILSEDEFSAYITLTRRGTNGYTAPEAWGGYPHFSSDYYSLGCTIATLYKGEHLYQRVIDNGQNDPAEMLNLMKKRGLPLDCPEGESDLQTLVNALTMYDFDMRAKHEDVLAWLEDSKHFTWAPWPVAGMDFSFTFDGVECHAAEDLIREMAGKWETAKRYLYSNTFHQFFAPTNPTVADLAYRIVNEGDTVYAHDLGLALFIQELAKAFALEKAPIIWMGGIYSQLTDISSAIRSAAGDGLAPFVSLLQSRLLTRTLQDAQREAEHDLVNAVKDIEDMAEAYPQFACYAFMYSCTTVSAEKDLNPDQIFKEMTTSKEAWLGKAREMLESDRELARFYGGRYGANARALKDALTGTFITEDGISDLALLYRFFEEICKDKAAVRQHFIQYGPRSYLHWLAQNMGLYAFHSPEAEEVKRRITGVSMNSKMSVEEISRAFTSLGQYVKDFRGYLQENYLLAALGIPLEDGEKPITTANTHGYFAGDFFGIQVPMGYCHYMGIE